MMLEERMKQKLITAFSPQTLEIINDSHLHEGHITSPHTGQSHFTIKMTADAFKDKSRLECHRLVYAVLANELKSEVHALRLDLK